MKYIIILLASITVLALLVGCGSTKSNFADLIDQGGELRVYEIFGMDCPGCHGGLENLVNKVPGVMASKANWEKQELQVLLTPRAEVTDDAIYEAIKKANFTPGKRLK